MVPTGSKFSEVDCFSSRSTWAFTVTDTLFGPVILLSMAMMRADRVFSISPATLVRLLVPVPPVLPPAERTLPFASTTVTSEGFMSFTADATRCTIACTSSSGIDPLALPAMSTDAVGLEGWSLNTD